MKTIILLFLLCFIPSPVFAQSDGLPRGAYLMPYTRYEATSTSLGGGATLLGPTFDQTKVQSEASDRICASLSAAGSSVSWTTTQAGQGLVLRYSIPDGQSGALGLFVNNTFVQNINVTTNVQLRDFYMNGENTTRTEYKGLTGGYGNNSIIERLWIEHFETGAWITTWTGAITNGLRVSLTQTSQQ